jgi:hypothetical protein
MIIIVLAMLIIHKDAIIISSKNSKNITIQNKIIIIYNS